MGDVVAHPAHTRVCLLRIWAELGNADSVAAVGSMGRRASGKGTAIQYLFARHGVLQYALCPISMAFYIDEDNTSFVLHLSMRLYAECTFPPVPSPLLSGEAGGVKAAFDSENAMEVESLTVAPPILMRGRLALDIINTKEGV